MSQVLAALIFFHFRPHDPEKLAEHVYAHAQAEKAEAEKAEKQGE